MQCEESLLILGAVHGNFIITQISIQLYDLNNNYSVLDCNQPLPALPPSSLDHGRTWEPSESTIRQGASLKSVR